jgi:group I intron endonuclease
MVIYKITNLVNGKIYIGQTIQKNPKMRWYAHLNYAKKGKKSHLYDSMRKYGFEKFSWEIIDTAQSLDELNKLEEKWLDHYRLLGKVYNNREAGNNKTHSLESIKKMQEVHTLRHATNNVGGWKRRDGGAMNGKIQSKCTCLFCKKEVGVNVLFRAHGEKCMFNPNRISTPKIILTCPHCELIGSGGNMKRYHFDNCKLNQEHNHATDTK